MGPKEDSRQMEGKNDMGEDKRRRGKRARERRTDSISLVYVGPAESYMCPTARGPAPPLNSTAIGVQTGCPHILYNRGSQQGVHLQCCTGNSVSRRAERLKKLVLKVMNYR